MNNSPNKQNTNEETETQFDEIFSSCYLPVFSFAVGLACFFLFMDNGLSGEHFVFRLVFNLFALIIWCAGARLIMAIALALLVPRYSTQSKKKRIVYAVTSFVIGALLFTLYHQ